jgi:hypothetical protein
MSEIQSSDIQRRIRETFGRELPLLHVEANRPRLRMMLSIVDTLDRWAEILDRSEPSSIHVTPTMADFTAAGVKAVRAGEATEGSGKDV